MYADESQQRMKDQDPFEDLVGDLHFPGFTKASPQQNKEGHYDIIHGDMKIDIKNIKKDGFVIEVMRWTPEGISLQPGWLLGEGTHIWQLFKEHYALLIPMIDLLNYARDHKEDIRICPKTENTIWLRSALIFPKIEDIAPLAIKRYEYEKGRMPTV